jgi:hypothetical protein
MPRPTRPFPLVVTFAVAGLACTAHTAGTLQVDGQPFEPVTCHSGQASGFSGVELVDVRDRKLRIAQNLDGSPAVVYFPSGRPVGEPLGPCATIHAGPGTGVINGVRNLDGTATLSCQTPERRVTGSVRFENCH